MSPAIDAYLAGIQVPLFSKIDPVKESKRFRTETERDLFVTGYIASRIQTKVVSC
jgi:hypothetical protein